MVPHAPLHTLLSGQTMCGEVDVHNIIPRGQVSDRFRRSCELLSVIKIRVCVQRDAYLKNELNL